MWLEKIFNKGITKEWLFLLSHSKIILFENGIISLYEKNGVKIINSGTVGNSPFTIGMRRIIIKEIKQNNKVVIQSSYKLLSKKEMKKLNLMYDNRNKCYIKGVL